MTGDDGMEWSEEDFQIARAAMTFDDDVAVKILHALIDGDTPTAVDLAWELLKDSERASHLIGTLANLAVELAIKLAHGDMELAKREIIRLIPGGREEN